MMDDYVCLRLKCKKGTGSNLLLYCREHADEIEAQTIKDEIDQAIQAEAAKRPPELS